MKKEKYTINCIYALQNGLTGLDTDKKPIKTDNECEEKYPEKQLNELGEKVETLPVEKLRYPIAVVFVVISKFFEALAANSIRTVMALFMRDYMHTSEELATEVLHVFNFFSQFCPIFGAILADSYIGNSKTLFIFYIPYVLGYIGLTLATVPGIVIDMVTMAYVSFFLIGVGNGNLRACVTSLGGYQFKVPEQKVQLETYFSHYYFAYTLGILLSKIIPPQVRASFSCWGETTCYTAVFIFITSACALSWFFFLSGLCFYRKETPSKSNVLFQVFGCIGSGIRNKLTGRAKGHPDWLSSTVGEYSEHFVSDVKTFLHVVTLYIPLPMYWTLLTQQDSTWTFQATQLNTSIGGFKIQPDQVKALGPLLLLIQIPIYGKIIQPILKKCCGFELHPLKSMIIGGVCAALSYVMAGVLQMYIDANPHDPPSVLWQFPQFFFVQLGELLLSIPGLKFSFTQAPKSLKSVLTACWFCNNAFGNLLVIVFTELRLVHTQRDKFFMFASFMFGAMFIFYFLQRRFKSIKAKTTPSTVIVTEKFIYAPDETEESDLRRRHPHDLEHAATTTPSA